MSKRKPTKKTPKKVSRKISRTPIIPRPGPSEPSEPGAISTGAVTRVDQLPRDSRRGPGTMYQVILDKMASLKEGDGFPVQIPEGVTARVFHVRLTSVIRRSAQPAPKGCVFVKHTTKGGEQIAIKCVAQTPRVAKK